MRRRVYRLTGWGQCQAIGLELHDDLARANLPASIIRDSDITNLSAVTVKADLNSIGAGFTKIPPTGRNSGRGRGRGKVRVQLHELATE